MAEYAEVYLISHPKARKLHKCCECHGVIDRGEKYCVHHGIFDGSPFRVKCCEDCDKLRMEINADVKDSEDMACCEQLGEYVFESRDLKFIKTYLQIKERRKAVIPLWMQKQFDELVNKEDEEAENVVDTEESLLYDS